MPYIAISLIVDMYIYICNYIYIDPWPEKVQISLQIIPQSHFLRRYDWIHREFPHLKMDGMGKICRDPISYSHI